ncbi:SDR family NAD(P)-dependent oxidoreductase [Amycolatopsis sp. NBC_00348]|uniref:SDR family NAD(P)-dependent oxidoreductase n=1 Tax=unclassified Amycolatopsis TaxID=2618356 RepID=UPI002E0F3991|nr:MULTISPECIES: SDR family NAD(P)-dependent oxidoreductase [unclassified Amycolatopsis]WSJ75041.1 SDR family NAD(P)-dependent oxidoreductase [Amycolatopsis sp. NBC_01307]
MTTALVTGGNRGIGKAIAAGLVRRGFTVYSGARDVGRGAAAAAEIGAKFVRLDVLSDEDVENAVAAIGELDVLVNNAGINAGGYGKPSDETAETLRRVYETNVFAVVRVTNAFLPLLRRSPAGRIVNVTSKRGSIGEDGAWAGQPSMSYSGSKTALNALTAHYARELADTKIKVNGAAPGHVATDFNGFRGSRTPEEGAEVAIRLATVDENGPTGAVFEDERRLAW